MNEDFPVSTTFLCRILHALLTYGVAAEADVSRWERNIHKLSQQQKALVPSQEPKFAALREAIIQNQLLLRSIALAFQEPNLTEGELPQLATPNPSLFLHA